MKVVLTTRLAHRPIARQPGGAAADVLAQHLPLVSEVVPDRDLPVQPRVPQFRTRRLAGMLAREGLLGAGGCVSRPSWRAVRLSFRGCGFASLTSRGTARTPPKSSR